MVLGFHAYRSVACVIACCASTALAEVSLEAAFRSPPDDASRPCVKLSLEKLPSEKAALFLQLSHVRDVGAGGVLLRMPVAGDAAWTQLALVSDTCRRLGLELGVCDFALSPEEADSRPRVQRVVWSAVQAAAAGPATNACVPMFQPGTSYRELARLAVPVESEVLPHQVVDVNAASVPTNGAWRVYCFGCTDAEPAQADCFDGNGVFRHVNQLLETCQSRLARTYGTTLLWCQMAGPGRNDLLWPRDLPETFLKQSGLNLMRQLPALAGVDVGGASTAAYVRAQVVQAMRESWRQRYAKNVNELIHEAGLEAGIGVDEVPLDPEETAQYFMRPTLSPARTPQQEAANVRAAGGARTFGRRFVVGLVEYAEAVSTSGRAPPPVPCKNEVDQLLGAGATRMLFSIPDEMPEEGERFAQLRTVCRYAQRCQILLQSGEPVADFLVWADGLPQKLEGYSCDFANQAMLRTAAVREGKLQFESERAYASLAVTAAVLQEKGAEKKLRQLAADGVTVWLIPCGRPEEEAVFARFAGTGAFKRWDAAGASVPVPDCQWRAEGAGLQLRFLHRRTPEREIYFVQNAAAVGGPATLVFRDAGNGVPQKWDPVGGEVASPLQASRATDGRVTLSVSCFPHDAFFIVFAR